MSVPCARTAIRAAGGPFALAALRVSPFGARWTATGSNTAARPR